MAIRPIFRKAVQSQIDWPVVGLAGAMAGVIVLSTTLMAWVAGRSVHSVSGGDRLGLSEASATQSDGAGRLQAERENEGLADRTELGNEESGRQNLSASYPEGDQGAVTAVEEKRQKQPARQNSSAPGACERPAENEIRSKVVFAKDPTTAAEFAKREHKLMLVLHVSGNFEESKFT